jgi:hypothetical protein
MNIEIFERLSRCQLTVVDLTGLRNNCFLELGFAYGRGCRVLLTAEESTEVPFDAKMIERFPWSRRFDANQEVGRLQTYARRHQADLPLVRRVQL